jgi:hypothetical protein
MTSPTFILTLIFTLLPLSSQAALRIDNWNTDIKLGEQKTMKLLKKTAKTSIDQIEKIRNCKGQIISVFIDPSSFEQNKKQESFEISYQLSYNQDICSQKLLVTCSLKISYNFHQATSSHHQCEFFPVYDSGKSSQNKGPSDNPDNRNENDPNVSDTNSDDSIGEPSRNGTDVDSPQQETT